MKKIIFTLVAVVMLFSAPVFAEDVTDAVTKAAEAPLMTETTEAIESPFPTLHKVEAKYVCMANNKMFSVVQIPTEVDGKTYYGCCSMCEERLKKDAALRKAIDPVSGAEVDKATAVIGAKRDGSVYYFENEENYEAFRE